MPFWFAGTLFTSAFLLFSIQPLVAKLLLPVYGGTPAVWNTCLMFFQCLLLAGYAYAHVLARHPRRPLWLHPLLVALGILLTPLVLFTAMLAARWTPPGLANPSAWLVAVLGCAVGVPFFLLSATAPLVQRWFADTGRDPYPLYAASNLGSLLALLSYPLLWEPSLRLRTQAELWIVGYGFFVALLAGCAILAKRGMQSAECGAENKESTTPPASSAFRAPRSAFWWLALSFVPASLLYGVTTYISTDVAAVPLLWVLPLGLYLLTFVLVFAQRPWVRQATLRRLFPLAVLTQTFFFAIPDARLLGLHLLVFFIVAWTCHGELAQTRPAPEQLTEFYLWLSLGGVLAGVFNTLLAPLLFDGLLEYPVMLVVACLLVGGVGDQGARIREDTPWPLATRHSPLATRLDWLDLWLPLCFFLLLGSLSPIVRANVAEPALRASLLYGLPAAVCYLFVARPVRFALGVAALLFVGGMTENAQGHLVERSRSFFGTVRVVDVKDREDATILYRRFVHGNTLHGMQRLDAGHERTPLTYYFHNGPIGQLFETFSGPRAKPRVGVLGLGAGTLATYAEPGQTWTFFEIDPEVVRVAWERFTFLRDAQQRGVDVRTVLGDARLALQGEPDGRFDLLFGDAFSSDAVPVHLLTREALELYFRKLSPHGVLVLNVTNRCLDLEPAVAALAEELSLAGRLREEFAADVTAEDEQHGKAPSRWLVLARELDDLGPLAQAAGWRPLRPRPSVGIWTDDYSDLVSVFRWWPRGL